ncbi:energy-coupling factor ABC transporter ATP-binding protein [Glutamicibacter sp. JL.03c]|uniref:ABC transporter ATP-binding protein n=1 Tax=Glutamicibacter sp. JL.03c TaxID=2984842 RepID=UPI0021F6DA99|nr:ABC transporter ATP-binding protein [Glutamicibacter sp. JL.03c]UYQ77244.1 energy-coupling factor ABC transporter ATP-binding protein [Glutamicibacter sp. JL.03c]
MERKLSHLSTSVLGLNLGRYTYADTQDAVLHNIQLDVRPGTLTVISGDSGSGKSTLGAILAGLLPRHGMDELAGSIEVGHTRIEFSASSAPRVDVAQWAKHVGLLPQDAGHYLSGIRGTVAEELAFSLENAGVPREQMQQRVSDLAQNLHLEHLLERHPQQLSGGQERLVALGALAMSEPDVLVLDEPLAGLDKHATVVVSEMIELLRARGTALVVLADSPGSWAREADELWRLNQGTLHRNPVEEPLTCISLPTGGRQMAANAPVLLTMDSVQLAYPGSAAPAVNNLNLRLSAGECLGLAGANGSGKTTVLKAIAGLLKPESGTLTLSGESGLLLQNSSDQLFERTVLREVAFGIPKKSALRQRVPELLSRLGLESHAQTHPYELPASARRLVALATVLIHEPQILLLDEPTESLDEAGEASLQEVIASVLDRGGAVVLSTHDEQFMRRASHRVHHMQ